MEHVEQVILHLDATFAACQCSFHQSDQLCFIAQFLHLHIQFHTFCPVVRLFVVDEKMVCLDLQFSASLQNQVEYLVCCRSVSSESALIFPNDSLGTRL